MFCEFFKSMIWFGVRSLLGNTEGCGAFDIAEFDSSCLGCVYHTYVLIHHHVFILFLSFATSTYVRRVFLQ